MRRFSGPILLIATLALLGVQSAGLHLHANPHTDGMQLHAEHVHDSDPDGHDHSADVDVALFELGVSWLTLAFLLPVSGVTLPAPPRTGWLVRPSVETSPTLLSQFRWRPPLRAPPQTS